MNNNNFAPTNELFTNEPNSLLIETLLLTYRAKFDVSLPLIERTIRNRGEELGFAGADAVAVTDTIAKFQSGSYKRFFIELGGNVWTINIAKIERELGVEFALPARIELMELNITRTEISRMFVARDKFTAKNFVELFYEALTFAHYSRTHAFTMLKNYLNAGRTTEEFMKKYNGAGNYAKGIAVANAPKIEPVRAAVYVAAWGGLYVEALPDADAAERFNRKGFDIFIECDTIAEAEDLAKEAGPHWAMQYERNRIQERINQLERELEAEREKLANA